MSKSHDEISRRRNGTGASTTEYARLKTSLAVCELIFKMADDRRRFAFPLSTSQFSATFLDFQRNSRGYEKEVNSADLDACKRLLSPFSGPFSPKFEVSSIPQCHRFGNAMWTIAKECTALQSPSRTQSTGLNPPACRLNSEEEFKVTSSGEDELSRSTSVHPHFASKNEPHCTAYKIPGELNEQGDLDTEPLKSDSTDTAVFHESSNIKASSNETDQNQNTVVSEISSSQNEGYRFPDCLDQQSSCKELCEVNGTEAVYSYDGNFQNHIEAANFESGAKLSTDCHLQNGFEKKAGIGGGKESKHNSLFSGDVKCLKNQKSVKTEESLASKTLYDNDIEHKDISHGRQLCDGLTIEKQKSLKESLYKEHPITPLPLYKQGNYNSKPISTSLTVHLNLEALLSVLHSKQKNAKKTEHENGDICGKVAILYGYQQNTTVSVLQTEMVGLYDYILGTVCGLQQDCYHDECESQDMKFPFSSSAVALDLEAFLAKFHHTMTALSAPTADGGKILKEHSPVAWLLTSPALGVTLDWQVQEKLLKFLGTLSSDEFSVEQESSASNNDRVSTQWYNLLVIIDEYRFVEKDIPLVEVYKLGTSGEIKLVNFDLN